MATYALILHFASLFFALAFSPLAVVRSVHFLCCFFHLTITKVECDSSSGDRELLWKYLWQSTQHQKIDGTSVV